LVALTLCVFDVKNKDTKIKCPNLSNKEKQVDKKNDGGGTTRRTYIACQDNDDTSSSCSSWENEEANMCLMAGYESSTNIVSFRMSMNVENYNQLLDAFKQIHEEAKILTLLMEVELRQLYMLLLLL